MEKLIKLMDEYLDLENHKKDMMQKVLDNDGHIKWNDIRPGLDKVGLLEAHTKVEEAQCDLLGKPGPYWGDLGVDETSCVFGWLKKLIEEL